jgi:hypothetical protein
VVAACLAWLVPGLGHWYQGRRHKAVLFFVCILGTFVYGLHLGEGRVVYASWRDNDWRPHYLCQVGVGLAAMPALVQARRKTPIDFRIYPNFMAPPRLASADEARRLPPLDDTLDAVQKRLKRFWELGTVYTMIAGLLNLLAIYDAWGGPAFSMPAPAKKQDDDSGGKPPGEPSEGGGAA